MSTELYPTQILQKKFVPIRDILKANEHLTEASIMSLVNKGKVMYALMKDPVGTKRIPHVNKEQLDECLGGIL